MVWLLNGTEATIVSEGARQHVWGIARQDVRLPSETSSSAIARIEGIEATWSINRSDAPDVAIDPNAEGLLKRVKAKPNATHFMISFYPEVGRGSVVASICMAPDVFDAQLPLWRDYVFRSANVRYSIGLDYNGFKVAHATTDNITAAEWIAEGARRKPVLGEGVAVSFSRAADPPALA
jgi:hypothetical protein